MVVGCRGYPGRLINITAHYDRVKFEDIIRRFQDYIRRYKRRHPKFPENTDIFGYDNPDPTPVTKLHRLPSMFVKDGDCLTPLCGYVMLVLCVCGLVNNIANTAVLTRRNMTSAANILLTALSVGNILLLTFYLPYIARFKITCDHCNENTHWVRFSLVFLYLYWTWYVYVLCLVQGLAVLQYRDMCQDRRATKKQSVWWVIVSCLVSLVLTVPTYYNNVGDWELVGTDGRPYLPTSTSSSHYNDNTIDQRSYDVYFINSVIRSVVLTLVVCVTTIILLIIVTIRRSHMKHDQMMLNQNMINELRIIDDQKMIAESENEQIDDTMMADLKFMHSQNVANERTVTNNCQKSSRQLSIVALIIFITTILPCGVLNLILSLSNTVNLNMNEAVTISTVVDMLVVVSCLPHCVLYCLTSSQYRRTLRACMTCNNGARDEPNIRCDL